MQASAVLSDRGATEDALVAPALFVGAGAVPSPRRRPPQRRGGRRRLDRLDALWRPEQMRARRDHATLVRLPKQLRRVLRRLRRQGIIISSVAVLRREERPDHAPQRLDLGLAVGQLVLVQDKSLGDKFIRDRA